MKYCTNEYPINEDDNIGVENYKHSNTVHYNACTRH